MFILWGVLIGLATSQLGFLVTTVYLHRALSHRAVTLNPAVQFACRAITWVATGIRPRQWAAVHRKHHAFVDEEKDPHSPVFFGYAKVQFANASLYRKVAKDPEQVTRYAKDLPADRWDKLLFDHALVGLGLGIGLLVWLAGWEIALVASVVHLAVYLLGGGAINGIGHRWGRRPYEGLATNNQWLAWIVAGEGLHSNHHAAATSARFSHERGQHDPGWWAVRTLMAFKLASVRHASVTVKARAGA